MGKAKIKSTKKDVTGEIVQFKNESYNKISNYNAMRPFFMSIVYDFNPWMIILIKSGITARQSTSTDIKIANYRR